MNDPDQEIINQIRAGNPRRFGSLVDRHKDRALTLAIRLVGRRGEAEELVQDAFLRAYHGLDDFRGDARFGTWFTRILYNLCLTRMARRRGREVEIPGEAALDRLTSVNSDPGIHQKLEEAEMQNLLAKEVERLPEKFRLAITLFYVQELTYEEMAEVTGLPMGTIKTNLFRGRQLLRRSVLERLKEEVKVA